MWLGGYLWATLNQAWTGTFYTTAFELKPDHYFVFNHSITKIPRNAENAKNSRTVAFTVFHHNIRYIAKHRGSILDHRSSERKVSEKTTKNNPAPQRLFIVGYLVHRSSSRFWSTLRLFREHQHLLTHPNFFGGQRAPANNSSRTVILALLFLLHSYTWSIV